MFLQKSLSEKLFIASTCSCLAIGSAIALPLSLSVFTPPVQAQSRKVRYVPPSNLGTPTVSLGGATRGVCDELATVVSCLIGLVPDFKTENAPVPQTISESPTFYFLVPEIDGRAHFYLSEVNSSLPNIEKRVYRTSFKIKNKAGILAFKIPMVKGGSILELDKDYAWKFTVGDFTISETVSGSIRRVLPSQKLVEQLKKASQPLDRAALFAQEGIWFETVQTLAEAQKGLYKKPEIVSEWKELLKSTKLERVIPYTFLKDAVTSSEAISPPSPNYNY